MSETKVGIIRETKGGKWMIEIDGKEVLQTKSLVWVKSNARKSAKLSKTGVRIFDVTEDGKTTRWDMDAKTVKAKKSTTPGGKKTKTTKTVPVKTETITVDGMNKLEGLSKTGKLMSRSNTVTVIEFLTKDKIAILQEFSTKTGEQVNHSPHHGWKIPQSA